MTAPPNTHFFDPDASIVLVGCRGAGKRTLGFIGALHLRWRLVTDDHYFEQVSGSSRGQYLARYGRAALAIRSAEVFRQMMAANPRRCIIECGLSSLTAEGQGLLRAYGEFHPVIYVHREPEQIVRTLGPADAHELLRVDPSHRQCSNYEYYNLYDGGSGSGSSSSSSLGGSEGGGSSSRGQSPWDVDAPGDVAAARLFGAKTDFTRFLDQLQGQTWLRPWAESPFAVPAIPPELRAYSNALRLRLSDLAGPAAAHFVWDNLEIYGDCVELIVDHWPDDLFNVIARQVARLRRALAAVPIIFHVEEVPRDERVRSQAERDRMDGDLLDLGLRLNVEYISIDLQRNPDLVRHVLARRGRTSVIGNWNFSGLPAPPWSAPVFLERYETARALRCSIVRIARFSNDISSVDSTCLLRAAILAAESHEKLHDGDGDDARLRLPLVAYDYSLLGVHTPMQSNILRPTKHPSLPTTRDHLAAFTQAPRLTGVLFLQGLLDPLQFYTVGSRIASSITPAMHRAAFVMTGLNHTFSVAECASLDDLLALFLDPARNPEGNRSFGGATLAAPFKVAIRPLLQLESEHATALGAVNVLLPLRGRPSSTSASSFLEHANARNTAGPCSSFYGDNTDWRSIHRCLQRALSPRNVAELARTSGLVVGAGGMARAAIYALIRLGCRHIIIYNRTPQNAHAIAHHFNAWAQTQVLHHHATHASTGSTSALLPPHTVAQNICRVLTSLSDPWPADWQPPTMVVSCVPALNPDGSPAATFEMPPQWMGSPTGGVAIELAYEPLVTPLVAQMQKQQRQRAVLQEAGATALPPPWVIMDGLEIVGEMAIEAFELLTGRAAPTRLMRQTCRKAWEIQQQGLPLTAVPMPEEYMVGLDVMPS